MASSAKYTKYDSAVDDIISIVKRSHFGKPVDEEFLSDLKSLMENKMIAAGLMKPAVEKSVLNTEFDCLPLPNEILVKIFGYLNIQEISLSAKVSHQFNRISKDYSLWQAWGKVSMYDEMKVSTEFLFYIVQRGITKLSLHNCEILPPTVKSTVLTRPLKLKTISLDETKGDKSLVNEILTSHPMEKVDLWTESEMLMSENDIFKFIKLLPQIGSQLKSLNLGNGLLGEFCDLRSISLIVDSCLDLEELNIRGNSLSEKAISYLCENLTPNVLKLDFCIGGSNKHRTAWQDEEVDYDKGLNDNNIRRLVERCTKLKVLDIRTNQKVTFQGLVAITDNLDFLEDLGLPYSVGHELGLPDKIDFSKMCRLRSVKKLKELFIGRGFSDEYGYSDEYQSILKREIPQLRDSPVNDGILVAMTNTDDYRSVRFCENCYEYADYWYRHKCLKIKSKQTKISKFFSKQTKISKFFSKQYC